MADSVSNQDLESIASTVFAPHFATHLVDPQQVHKWQEHPSRC